MENEHPENLTPETDTPQPTGEAEDPRQPAEEGYVPRPRWQVWLARIGLALFILVILLYYLKMMRSGL